MTGEFSNTFNYVLFVNKKIDDKNEKLIAKPTLLKSGYKMLFCVFLQKRHIFNLKKANVSRFYDEDNCAQIMMQASIIWSI